MPDSDVALMENHAPDRPTDATNPLSILQCVIERKATPAEIKAVMDIANQWQDREAARVFGEHFAEFQAECPQIVKSRDVLNKADQHGNRSLRYKFASLDDVDEVVRPLLAKHRLSVSGTINTAAEAINVTWTIQSGSHKERREFALPKIAAAGIVQGGGGLQDLGAWLSYIRRYTYCLALNIVVTGEDNDANSMADLIRVNDKQRAELDALIAQEQMDEAKVAKLLRWVGADSLDAITQPQFQKIVTTYRQRKAGAA